MRKIREILRLKWDLGLTHREISQSCGLSSGAITECLKRAQRVGLSWPLPDIDDAELEGQLYPPAMASRGAERAAPDMAHLHVELRSPGVTLRLLWEEYIAKHPQGFRYTQFCVRYASWLERQRPTMRQVHIGGDKLFVDYSGKKPLIVDRETGELIPVELFVAVLGASNWTYVEATLTQRSPDWIASHIRCYEKMGGVPRANVPDQLKSAVTTHCRYEPGAQRTYEEMCRHYGTSVLPARPKKPRDKAKAEVGVQIAQRWVLAKIRHERFFSLDELNERIAELTDELNARKMRRYGASRQELFERLERPVDHLFTMVRNRRSQ
jgi:transposase